MWSQLKCSSPLRDSRTIFFRQSWNLKDLLLLEDRREFLDQMIDEFESFGGGHRDGVDNPIWMGAAFIARMN